MLFSQEKPDFIALDPAEVHGEGTKAAMGMALKHVPARRVHPGTFDTLDAPHIAHLAEFFRVAALQDDDAGRWGTDERELVLNDCRELGVQKHPSDEWMDPPRAVSVGH